MWQPERLPQECSGISAQRVTPVGRSAPFWLFRRSLHKPRTAVESWLRSEAPSPWSNSRYRQSLVNISKRLGGEGYKRLAAIMDQALAEQANTGAVDLHRGWIEALLKQYYDPMYAYQRQSKASRIEFAGEQDAVVEFLRARAASKQM